MIVPSKVSLLALVSRPALSSLALVDPLDLPDLLLVALLPLALTDALCPLLVAACRLVRDHIPTDHPGITKVKMAAAPRLLLVIALILQIPIAGLHLRAEAIARIHQTPTAGPRLPVEVTARIRHQMECSHLGSLNTHALSPLVLATVSLSRGL